ncbi:stalk domain-containing protein [Peribacillus loiseleuriae]|uniref:stalk domain-containing protein n=1 Tax=Peribacillus loiseleuriae TaxID=1679170 RepID=UPI00069D6095|nr:stalk domain-containing protein [Peribacillus loiseleuriae]
MRQIHLIFVILLTVFIVFSTGTTYAMNTPKTIQAYEESYFISYNNQVSLAQGKLITYKNEAYLPLQDAALLLGLTLDLSSEDIYLSGSPSVTLTKAVSSLPKDTVDFTDTFQINPKIGAYSGFVIEDGKNGVPVFSKNANQRLYPSSTTKIMTALLAIKHGNLNEVVTIGPSAKDIPADSSVAGIKPGDKMTLEQLLYAMMLPSGNDAAAAIAEHIGGSEQQFVQMMNVQAKELGATNTSLTNPHGYHHPNLYTTASDLALIAKDAAKYPAFLKIASTPVYSTSYRNKSGQTITKTWKNTNQLVQATSPFYLPSAQAGKTGYTSHSGHNLVSFVTMGDHNYIIVLLRGEKDQRYIDTKNLVNTAYVKRVQLNHKKTTMNILPFKNKIYVNNDELQTHADIFINDGQIFISTDIFKELSPGITNVKVSDTQTPQASLNHELLSFDQDTPIIQNGRMLVPIRPFFEKAGLDLNWDQNTQTVEAYSSNTVIQMKINSKNGTVNGQNVALDVPATIQNGRTLVPIRFISEATGLTVDWGRGRTLYLY